MERFQVIRMCRSLSITGLLLARPCRCASHPRRLRPAMRQRSLGYTVRRIVLQSWRSQ